MKKLIQHIRSKPESVRKVIAHTIVISIGAVLVAIMVMTVWINHRSAKTTSERPTLTESLLDAVRSY